MKQRKTVVILSAADNLYVQHLAVTFVSALVNLSPDWQARFYVADAELTPHNRLLLTRTVRNLGGEIEFLAVRKEYFNDLFIAADRHITQAGYYRLIMPGMLRGLPFDRAIYLDCDVIVRDDISAVAQTPMGRQPIGAVEDLGGGFRLADLSMPEGAPYFNSGVMLINLPRWREQAVAEKVFCFLRENRHRLYFHDQDGLNAILHGQWLPLDPKWNVQRNMLGKIASASDREGLFRSAARCPSIVHFTGKSKPWHFDNAHPYKREYYRYLALTEWRQYKPRASLDLIIKRGVRFMLPDGFLSTLKKIVSAIGRRRRSVPTLTAEEQDW